MQKSEYSMNPKALIIRISKTFWRSRSRSRSNHWLTTDVAQSLSTRTSSFNWEMISDRRYEKRSERMEKKKKGYENFRKNF